MSDRYVVVIERAPRNYSAYIPDLAGCVATGGSVEETVRAIGEAMALHLEAMRRDGEPVPPAATSLADARLHPTEDAIGVVDVSAATGLAT